jgi:hypothetical protein
MLHVGGNTFSNTFSTNGGISLNRNGDEANLQFQRDGTPTAQLRALNGGGFRITAAAAATEWARFHSTGNFGINTGATDGGQRLQVTGDTLLRGSGATSGTTALTVQNSGTNNIFRIRNDGYVFFGTQNTFLFPTADGSDISTSGRGLFIGTNAAGQGTGAVRISGSSSITTGNDWSLWLSHSFAPTSGTASHSGLLLNQTINQTGGANGITRGLYVNPTLTAAADFRAIETSAGNVLFGSGFFWDNANSRLGIGTNTPAYGLDVSASVRFTNTIGLSTGYSWSVQRLQFNNGTAGTNLGYIIGSSNGVLRLVNAAEADFTRLQFGGFTSSFPALQRVSNAIAVVDATGAGTSNLLVGSTTDSGERLQVTGTMRVTAPSFNNTTFANAGQAVYNTYAPTGYASWIIGVETQYFLGYSGRNILVFSRDRNHTTGGIDNNYIGFGHLGPTANVDIASSSTARASLRIRSGVAPTTPNDGDIWYDGTDIKMRIGGVTKTFTLI